MIGLKLIDCLKLVAFFHMDVVGSCVMILIMDAAMIATDAIAMAAIVMDVIVMAAIVMDVIVMDVIVIVIAIENFKSQSLIL